MKKYKALILVVLVLGIFVWAVPQPAQAQSITAPFQVIITHRAESPEAVAQYFTDLLAGHVRSIYHFVEIQSLSIVEAAPEGYCGVAVFLVYLQ